MEEPQYGERLVGALEHAARWHQTDRRKGTTIPYLSHPLRVCALVLDDGGSEDEACAALLHDTLDDTPATPEDLIRLFGHNVARIVELCTDTDDVAFEIARVMRRGGQDATSAAFEVRASWFDQPLCRDDPAQRASQIEALSSGAFRALLDAIRGSVLGT